MKKLFYGFLLVLPLLAVPRAAEARELQWSRRIAKSFLTMHPDSIVYPDEKKSRNWNYEQGLIMEALFQTWKSTGDEKYFSYIRSNLDHYIEDNGHISTYVQGEFQLDNIVPGKAALRVYQETKIQKYKLAADTLRRQLAIQPRTPSGGFWHKKAYPNQMWLDGLYMAEPFYAMYSVMSHDTAAFRDIAHQFILAAEHTGDKKTGLYFHGWDESKTERWADSATGCSPNLWGRAIGWYAMALVDVLDSFPKHHPDRAKLIALVRRTAASLADVQDPKTKLWYQLPDKPEVKGNYIEASASSMITYFFAKGANKGYLSARYKTKARESFKAILDHLVEIDSAGVVHLQHVVSVGGLGGKPYRDGSVAYYLSEPQRKDDFKGYGPFWLAALEVEKK
jgi:unsaturated rhamnogalacturonyl hydrolase